MNIDIVINIENLQDGFAEAAFASENQTPAPTAHSDGISFPNAMVTDNPLRKSVWGGVMAAAAVGALTLGIEPVDLSRLQDITILTGPVNPSAQSDTVEVYQKLREEIVAAGIPLLTGEELRQEIRERKGLGSEPDV